MIKRARSHETPEPFDEEIHQAAGQGDIREAFRQKANAETLQFALEKLPEEFREMIVLHDLEGLTYKEIAGVAGIPIGTVMSRLARARERLRGEIVASNLKGASE
jgi:RNA polymerase sigma-70 factor (ECF subfamily)